MTRRGQGTALSRLRCAIYTRKSSEEGLEQDFNSLHAQREACEAYVQSQAGEGWTALKGAYDDGGYSGGSLDRPGLAKLLADVDAGRIDVVVVYKVDRLTRSLADFAKIVDRFDAQGVSFVSVTQAFNTTTSMGRLTLNVLLSFAQFEREVTGERIRDKIAASKAKGMWMGGSVPFGYDAKDRSLVVNSIEAEQVRRIFARYLALGSVHALRDELEAAGVRSKVRISRRGNVQGGKPFGRGALFHLLSNRHYRGEIPHKGQVHPGLHEPIVDAETFEAAQRLLSRNRKGERRSVYDGSPGAQLTGRLYDDRGAPMSPVNARRGSRIYRYYVSSALQKGDRAKAGSLSRAPAAVLEALVADRLDRLGPALSPDLDPNDAVRRVLVSSAEVRIHLDHETFDPDRARLLLPDGDRMEHGDDGLVLTIAARLGRCGGRRIAIAPNGASAIHAPRVDATLLKALVRAAAWKARLQGEGPAALDAMIAAEGVDRAYAQRLIRVAFLAPAIKGAILEGRTPPHLTLQALMQGGVPLAWTDQQTAYG